MRDAAGKPTDTTHAEQVEQAGGEIPMPDLQAPYLLDWLQSAGVHEYGSAGPIPLSSVEISAWSQGCGIALRPWEFEALRDASRAFVVEFHDAHDYPPYGDSDDLADPDTVDDALERGLDRLAAAPLPSH